MKTIHCDRSFRVRTIELGKFLQWQFRKVELSVKDSKVMKSLKQILVSTLLLILIPVSVYAAETPAQTYQRFVKTAKTAKLWTQIRPFFSVKGAPKTETKESQEYNLLMIQSNLPLKIQTVSEKIISNKAIVEIKGSYVDEDAVVTRKMNGYKPSESDYEHRKVHIEMVKEGGVWKLDSESWTRE